MTYEVRVARLLKTEERLTKIEAPYMLVHFKLLEPIVVNGLMQYDVQVPLALHSFSIVRVLELCEALEIPVHSNIKLVALADLMMCGRYCKLGLMIEPSSFHGETKERVRVHNFSTVNDHIDVDPETCANDALTELRIPARVVDGSLIVTALPELVEDCEEGD
jgi:hypothetical protein